MPIILILIAIVSIQMQPEESEVNLTKALQNGGTYTIDVGYTCKNTSVGNGMMPMPDMCRSTLPH